MSDGKKTTPPASGGGGKPAGTCKGSCSETAPTGYSGKGGTVAYTDKACEVKTGVVLQKDGVDTTYTDAVAIQVKCTKNPHVLQFIYREIIGKDGKPVAKEMTTTGGKYQTTTDPKKPNWNTDSAAKPTPYYEAKGASRSDPGSLTIYDQPRLTPGEGETWRATFKAFLICDGKVVRVVTWVREQQAGKSPTYSVSAEEANKLPEWAKKQLKDQGYDNAP